MGATGPVASFAIVLKPAIDLRRLKIQMRKLQTLALTIGLFTFLLAAQPSLGAEAAPLRKSPSVRTGYQPPPETTATKKAILVEYVSWFETLKLKGPALSSEIATSYYGAGILFDYTSYYGRWGYGVNAGIAQGFAGAGNSLSSSSYAQTRVPWQAFRGGFRGFWRFSPRFELGPSVAFFYKSISWPTNPTSGYTPINANNPITGFFMEMRWRLNKKWEMQQAAGSFNLNSAMAWRLGLGYAF
jgi:hypothetical protein